MHPIPPQGGCEIELFVMINWRWSAVTALVLSVSVFLVWKAIPRVPKAELIIPQGYLSNGRNVQEAWNEQIEACVRVSPKRTWLASLTHQQRLKTLERFHIDDYNTLMLRLNGFWQALHDEQDDVGAQTHVACMYKLLFSMLNQSIDVEWLKSRRKQIYGRGLVYPIGQRHARLAHFSILNARLLGCTLPIEVHHDGDLSPEQIRLFESMANVTMVDSRRFFDMKHATHLMSSQDGWSAKPRAVLASNFREVMVVDSDIVWFYDPTRLFEGPEYRETGTLFFYDRRVLLEESSAQRAWLASFLDLESPTLRRNRNRMRLGKNYYEMESGVVLIDVARHFEAVMTVARLNTGDLSRKAYSMSYGDKETWWIGWEMMNAAYLMNDLPSGTMGTAWKWSKAQLQAMSGQHPWEWIDHGNTNAWTYVFTHRNGDEYRVCGAQLVHPYRVDGKLVPFWTNAGPTLDKTNPNADFMHPDAWILERDVETSPTGARFVLNARVTGVMNAYCLQVSAKETSDVTRVHWIDEDSHLLELLPKLKHIWTAEAHK